jgi:hypothetical protein
MLLSDAGDHRVLTMTAVSASFSVCAFADFHAHFAIDRALAL